MRPRKDADCNTLRARLTLLEARSLTLTVRFHSEGIVMARESARFSRIRATAEDAWVSGAHEHQERPSGAEAPPRQGPQAPDGQQRVAAGARLCRCADSGRTSAFAAAPSSSRSTSAALGFTAASARCSSCPTSCAVGRLGIAATRKLGGAVAEKPSQTTDSRGFSSQQDRARVRRRRRPEARTARRQPDRP